MAENADKAGAPREFIIQGITKDGKTFRPSDWAERLCGVMSCFGDASTAGPNAHLQYSRFVRPTVIDGKRCVIVSEALRTIEPLAYHFVLNFAKDNDLQVSDHAESPEKGA